MLHEIISCGDIFRSYSTVFGYIQILHGDNEDWLLSRSIGWPAVKHSSPQFAVKSSCPALSLLSLYCTSTPSLHRESPDTLCRLSYSYNDSEKPHLCTLKINYWLTNQLLLSTTTLVQSQWQTWTLLLVHVAIVHLARWLYEDIVGFMDTTPPTHACAVRFMNFSAETKFEKGASDRNSPPGLGEVNPNGEDSPVLRAWWRHSPHTIPKLFLDIASTVATSTNPLSNLQYQIHLMSLPPFSFPLPMNFLPLFSQNNPPTMYTYTTSTMYYCTMSFTPILLWRAKTLHHNIQSSAQAIILTPKTQSKQFLPKYVILKLSLSAVYLSPLDDVHIKIFKQCGWCVSGRWEGGQQCSVTASWWCYLEAYTFVGCKLHCCILILLTHYQNMIN